MATEYRLNNTGPELQELLNQVTANKEAIGQETQDRSTADTQLRKELSKYADEKVQTEQQRAEGAEKELQESIDGAKERIDAIEDTVFPITLTLSVSYSNKKHSVSFTVKENGTDFIGDTLTLVRTLANGTSETITNVPAASGSYSLDVKSNREIFKLDVTKAGRTSKSASATKYICYAGASADGNISEGMLSGFNMVSVTGVGFNPTVTTVSGQYIWLVVPSYLTINKVTSDGFEVTLAAAQNITTALGTFKAYRTANPLSAAVWNLVIS